ncbi:MAG: response regulator [Acidimicrobiales bacterium]|nr:response regulator [Acidimicrobiales bacterium]
MTSVLLATDADWIADEVVAALADDDTTVSRVRAGAHVRAAVGELEPELVVLDLQIGNMGGIAAALDLRLEAGAGRLPHTRVLLLLDREADVWIARQADSDGWLLKPLDAFRLRRAAAAVLSGDTWFEGLPEPV